MDEVSIERELERCAIFKDAGESYLYILSGFVSIIDIPAGRDAFAEGDDGQFMGTVLSGALEVNRKNANGSRVAFAKLGRGETFGEMSILDGGRRSASCTAVENSRVMVLTRDRMSALVEQYPRVGYMLLAAIARNISKRLREADRCLVEM